MDFNECTISLKYIKQVMDLFQRIDEKAQQLHEEKDNHIYKLDQKHFKKLWNLQKKRLRRKLVIDHYTQPEYLPTKIKSFFFEQENKKDSPLEKLDKFFSSLEDDNFIVDLKTPLNFRGEKLITLTSYRKTFGEIIEYIIDSIQRYPKVSYGFHLEPKHLPLLKQLKENTEKENYDSVIVHYKEHFDNFVREQFEQFVKETEEDRLKTSLFSVGSYLSDSLMQTFDFTRHLLIKDEIKKHRIIYNLCVEAYSKQFTMHNTLTLPDISRALRMKTDPLNLIDGIDPLTMMFEERNVLKELNILFNVYTDTHEALEKICIEMFERNLIPKNIQDELRNDEGHFTQFSKFFTRVVDRHELHKKLTVELPDKTEAAAPSKKQKVKI